jgi:hypothetical protein
MAHAFPYKFPNCMGSMVTAECDEDLPMMLLGTESDSRCLGYSDLRQKEAGNRHMIPFVMLCTV